MADKVLVIEDEPNIIEAISFILSRDGLSVKTHCNGLDAVAVIREQAPDVLILDVMLPGRSGYDILRDLREDADLAHLPVLMLTARGQTRDRDMAAQLGANHYMTKPFANADVLAAVRALIAR